MANYITQGAGDSGVLWKDHGADSDKGLSEYL